ncbi:MAG: hypothetical protein A2511_01185 [Deltaproteobacteria bacterium RIFOXYD12_FULL_50_9]|nr:MAG: hypothetical protein A2511_01185 [Deltaproteobacteria bacterium RIFOXYD12_FULL_50_9]
MPIFFYTSTNLGIFVKINLVFMAVQQGYEGYCISRASLKKTIWRNLFLPGLSISGNIMVEPDLIWRDAHA